VGNAARLKEIMEDRRRLQEANERYRQDLEVLVGQRTEQLQASNAELQAALRELRDAQQQVIRQERLNALGHMASGIAHDFNNVLMPVLGLSGFLLSHKNILDDKAETVQALETIHSAATDAREIVRRLREIYKPSDSLEVEAVSLADLVEQCVTLTKPAWRPQAEAEGHCITVGTDIPSLPSLMLNASQMRETLTNLILNAIDAMPQGGDIQIAAHEEDVGVCLTISDTGSGMPEETVQRCCEPFFTTKGEHGTGLGLAMCHGIVQRHGGSLDIESTEGVGTVVSIHLPLESPEHSRQATKPQPDRSAQNCRILVVDDEDISRELVALYLSSQGHTPICASGGPEALEQLQADDFDLIIADRAMPGMAGDEVAVRAHELAPDVPFVLLTGFGDLMNSRNEQPEYVDVVASKPITSDELANVLDAAIGARAGKQE
jgi:signal transduction histidine kinase/ActR/RegA family two-component response regulator